MDEIQVKILIELIIEWNKNRFEININVDDTVKDLKHIIFTLTNIQPNRQHFTNLTYPVSMRNDFCKIKQLNLRPRSVIKVIEVQTVENNRLPALSIVPYPSLFERRVTRPRAKEFKFLNKPRLDKKLVVLDVDGTIYDCSAPHCFLAARPHLEEFLTNIYEDYDIGIWSATSMKILETKMERLGMNTHPRYKLLFYMDKYSTVMASYKGCMVQVKPLELVWTRFPEYGTKNTLMCDDRKLNFYLNSNNGITVTVYNYKNHHIDKELKYLNTYLKSIAKVNDFTKINHEQWRATCDDDDSRD
ncbi:hypothetical protein ILUMI_20584 [Ignelater luminosus]|uniref:FCP1 homology domain-containing protein n=1 Tax=Ignelater luminosus TaxID=2038154 RepID=A0A8K0FYT0_IGNLU|nr:hypothetical protein ILUMI_20584 [Ignelater luminosus]